MNHKVKIIAFGAVVITAAVLTTRSYRKITSTERAKRADIKKNKILDLDAIARTQEVLFERIDNGVYAGRYEQLLEDMTIEFEFQKIAVREDL